MLLALRAGGEQIGWGFQLQSPLFVTLMIYLLLAVGLNLSGVFEVGGGLAGIGDSLTQGDSYRASFFTGVLTTLVATPCTAPFMAAAVGAALTQSPLVALSIFAALGAGLSLPYLLLSLAPWMRRALPKPGAWMDTLKQVFAFPMYASAAWLLWVLAQQTSSIGLGAALAGAILVALAAWAYQKSKGELEHAAALVALATSAAAVLLAARAAGEICGRRGRCAESGSGLPRRPSRPKAGSPTMPHRVAELRASGAPLLVNFTASWCLTCLVNERNAFADAAVQQIFRSKGVTLMKGDWTNRDPAITQALADFGRAGVPLYVVYNSKPGSSAPVVLPQLLTAGIVAKRVRRPARSRFKITREWRMLAGMASDNAGTVSVIDFRRQSMVLQWHVLGGTWTAYDVPPSLVHGVALIRARPAEHLRVRPRRPVAPAGRTEAVRAVREFAAHQMHARHRRVSAFAGASPSNRAPAACCSATRIGPIKARIFSAGWRRRAQDPDWRVAVGRQWSEGVAAPVLRSS